MICYYCGVLIPQDIIDKRHYTSERKTRPVFCSKICIIKYRKGIDFYKKMSLAGSVGRSKALPTSNRINPRRKKGGL